MTTTQMQNNSFRSILTLVFVVLTVALSVSAQIRPKQSKDKLALTALVKQMTEAQSKFDPATLERIYAADLSKFLQSEKLTREKNQLFLQTRSQSRP